MKKQNRNFFKSKFRRELSGILENAQNIRNLIETHYHSRKPFSKTLNNKTGEYVFYHPKTKSFQTYFRDENGVLYEISILKR